MNIDKAENCRDQLLRVDCVRVFTVCFLSRDDKSVLRGALFWSLNFKVHDICVYGCHLKIRMRMDVNKARTLAVNQ